MAKQLRKRRARLAARLKDYEEAKKQFSGTKRGKSFNQPGSLK